jgi:hypothetical protein
LNPICHGNQWQTFAITHAGVVIRRATTMMATPIEKQPQIYTVDASNIVNNDSKSDGTLNTKLPQHYTLRGLHQDELNEWEEFCASVFAHKPHPPPADYFCWHSMNYPCHGPTLLICVAVWNDDVSHKEIVLSFCCIFLKKVLMGGGRFAKA